VKFECGLDRHSKQDIIGIEIISGYLYKLGYACIFFEGVY